MSARAAAAIAERDFEHLPGGDLVRQGLEDLRHGRETVPALLVSIGAPRLRRLGLEVPESSFASPEHRLYGVLAADDPDTAHSRYNAYVRRLVSFERTAACADPGRVFSVPGYRL